MINAERLKTGILKDGIYHLIRMKSSRKSADQSSGRSHSHRTRLTNLLWKERYAKGKMLENISPASEISPKYLKRAQSGIDESGLWKFPGIDQRNWKLMPKSMKDSYCEITLPFRQDLNLREEYVNLFRGLRLGKILEDLDAFAASIAYKHCINESKDFDPKSQQDPSTIKEKGGSMAKKLKMFNERETSSEIEDEGDEIKDILMHSDMLPFSLVTASMDRMDLLNPLRPDLDIKMYGHVTYVGTSSIQVTVRVACLGNPKSLAEIDLTGIPLKEGENVRIALEQDDETGESLISEDWIAEWTPLLFCRFTLVARSRADGSAWRVNPLVATSEMEKDLISMGKEKKREKIELLKHDLLKNPPTNQERMLIHKLWEEQQSYLSSNGDIDSRLLPEDVSLFSETRQSNIRLCHPQERNIHGSVFGGFLMREAFELAYTTASIYVGGRVWTVSMDDIAFRKPVPVGSILSLSSEVTYAEGEPRKTFQVSVMAEVISDLKDVRKDLTNVFHFTFARHDESMTWTRGMIISAAKANENSQDHGRVGLVKRLMPLTYSEIMKYLLGKRRKERGIAEKKEQLLEYENYRVDRTWDKKDKYIF